MISWLLAVLLASAFSARASSLTINKLVQSVLAKGADKTIELPLAQELNFPNAVNTKALGFGSDQTKDKHSHFFFVVYSDTATPYALVWGNVKPKQKGISKHLDGMNFRTTLDGTLVRAIRSTGNVGEIEHKQVSPRSASAKAQLKVEIKFFLSDPIVQAALSQ